MPKNELSNTIKKERTDKMKAYLYKKRRLFITRFIFRKSENYGCLENMEY